jgi:hypothetical protein
MDGSVHIDPPDMVMADYIHNTLRKYMQGQWIL